MKCLGARLIYLASMFCGLMTSVVGLSIVIPIGTLYMGGEINGLVFGILLITIGLIVIVGNWIYGLRFVEALKVDKPTEPKNLHS